MAVFQSLPASFIGGDDRQARQHIQRIGQLQVFAAQKLETDAAPRGDVAFVALDDDHSKRYVPRLVELGYADPR